ncbi:MAG: flagellar biosynthesis protein FlhF [Deltaproteobacteria bacterium]|nr:MAG: flagellar biosynthesis protein FlhF [Deltaproteobacteria bacterium]
MQVRVFEADNMTSGLSMIKKEMGPDALILSSRSIKSGKGRFSGKTRLEITAAIDRPDKLGKKAVKTPGVLRFGGRKKSSGDDVQLKQKIAAYQQNSCCMNIEQEDAYCSQPEPLEAAENLIEPAEKPVQPDHDLQEELRELKSLVKNLGREISQIGKAGLPNMPHSESRQIRQILQGVRENFLPEKAVDDPVMEILLDRGVNLETSTTIAGFIRESAGGSLPEDHDQLVSQIKEIITPLLKTHGDFLAPESRQHKIALIGPTGVGKTTTIAKLAAKYLGEHSNSIALITIDTYRIAAVEQLRVYGEIMNLPVEVVITPDDLARALAKHQDKELILIDTAGRSPRDELSIDELGSFLLPEFEIKKHLVLSAATRESELATATHKFERLGIDQMVITKIDECQNLGVLLNLQIQNPGPISIITNGQRVPEDIIIPDPQLVAGLIMSSNQEVVYG